MALLALAFLPLLASAAAPPLPGAAQRRQITESLVREMVRLDGEGLLVREGRPRPFAEVAQTVALEAEAAATWPAFQRALRRLDLAYPNLHASFEAGPDLPREEPVIPLAEFTAEWLAPGKSQFRIRRVDERAFPADTRPEKGDLLLAINGRAIEEWKRAHFDFCKWPLAGQCDRELARDFSDELAGWNRAEPLSYTLRRGERTWTTAVPLGSRPARPRNDDDLLCGNEPNRYPGFRLAHRGSFACFFEREGDPTTLLLRITSFLDEKGARGAAPASPEEEVRAFLPFWRAHAPRTRHLLIDVSDNGGGSLSIPYYEVFFDRPYQEQWVQFRKVPELEDPRLRASLFWETKEQEIWFRNLRAEGAWDGVRFGDFLPAVPMFCALEGQDCRRGLFPVNNPGFRGKVSLLVNQGCVSSCDGFVFAFQRELGERVRVYGQPQAADTAYSRLRIAVMPSAGGRGYELRVLPQYGTPPRGVLFSQVVTVTRSVERDGTVVSGKPLPLRRFVPNTLEREMQWVEDALAEALLD